MEVFAILYIISNTLSLKQITANVTFESDEAWNTGDLFYNQGGSTIPRIHDNNGLKIEISSKESHDINAIIMALKDKIKNNEQTISDLKQQGCNVNFLIAIYDYDHNNTGFYLNETSIQWIAKINALLNLDVYSLADIDETYLWHDQQALERRSLNLHDLKPIKNSSDYILFKDHQGCIVIRSKIQKSSTLKTAIILNEI